MKGRVSRPYYRCIHIIQLNQMNKLVALDEVSSVSGPETFGNPSSNFKSYEISCNKFTSRLTEV